MNDPINEIKQFRLQLDGLAQLVADLKPVTEIGHEEIGSPDAGYKYVHREYDKNSTEIIACKKDLFFAKAWAGKLLGFLGQETPYKNDGKRKDVADIEPTDDHVEEFQDDADYESKNHIEKVDYLRQAIQVHVDHVLEWSVKPVTMGINRSALWCIMQIWVRLVDARLNLGYELQRIAEEAQNEVS